MDILRALEVLNGAFDYLSECEISDEQFKAINEAEDVINNFVRTRLAGGEVPMCPICGEELEYDSFYYEECDGNRVYFNGEGYCPECNDTYSWTETYTLHCISGLRKTGSVEPIISEELES